MKCKRTSCQASLDGLEPGTHTAHYRIWNEPSTGKPNTYCVHCGRLIIEYNQDRLATVPNTIELRYEVVDKKGNIVRGNTDAAKAIDQKERTKRDSNNRQERWRTPARSHVSVIGKDD